MPKRTRPYRADTAIANSAERELEIIQGIKRGLEDMRAGRTIPHKEAMRRLRATVARAAHD
jgi:predicted transcriptional regulator